MNRRAVIFDLDGTLADTLDDLAASMNHALARFGLPGHDRSAYRQFVGQGADVLAQRAAGFGHEDIVADLLAHFKQHYAEHCFDRTALYPGIADLLDGLTERGVRLAVLSNKPHPGTVQMVERLLGRWHFDAVVGQQDDLPRKPDPASARRVAGMIDVAEAHCLFVGDSSTDMQTARSAGMTAIGALWGFRDRAELEATGAHTVIAHPMQLLQIVDMAG